MTPVDESDELQSPPASEDAAMPVESDMDREDALDAFIAILNELQPIHPFEDDPYPVAPNDVDYRVTRKTLARAGPCQSRNENTIRFGTRLTFVNEATRETHLAVLVHEATHITINSYSDDQHGAHPPRFWQAFAVNAAFIAESIESGDLASVFPNANVSAFRDAVLEDAHDMNVDMRYWSAEECRAEVRDVFDYARTVEEDLAYLPAAHCLSPEQES